MYWAGEFGIDSTFCAVSARAVHFVLYPDFCSFKISLFQFRELQMALTWDRFCSSSEAAGSPWPEHYVTAPNNPRLEQSLTKSVCSVFGSKSNMYIFLRRRTSDEKWKLCNQMKIIK